MNRVDVATRGNAFLRRTSVKIAAFVSCVLFLGIPIAWRLLSRPRLNVVLVTLDTTRADRIGCYGYGDALTPALDALAQRGVRCSRAYTTCPLTLPSHTTMLTGLFPSEHGLQVNGRGKLGTDVPLLGEALQNANYRTGAFLSSFVLHRKFGLSRGFGTYDDDLVDASQADDSVHRRRDGKSTMESAIKWIKAGGSRPFFCWIHLFDAHHPYDARQEIFDDTFAERPYDAGIAYLDRQVQRLVDTLADARLDEGTLVVVVADHGEGLMEHQEKQHGMQLYDSTVRVPLIFRGPNPLASGLVVHAPVSLVDLAPTILDLAGLPSLPGMGARSFKAALTGAEYAGRPCFAETDAPFAENGWSPLRALVGRQFKYILTSKEELYDLANDPGETKNLIRNPKHKLDRMRLADWLHGGMANMSRRAAGSVHLTAEEQRVLESLGYAAGATASAPPSAPQARLPDVKDMLPHYNALDEAKHLLETGETDAAIEKVRGILEQAPEYSAAQVFLGDALMSRKQFAEAALCYEKVLAEKPDRALAHAHLANARAAQGDLENAVVHFRRALELDSEGPNWRFALARALLLLKRPAEAIAELEDVVRCDPGYVGAHTNLGVLLPQIGRRQEAIAHFQEALKYRPDLLGAHVGLATLLAEEGRFEDALAHASRVVEIEPEDFDARFDLGQLLLRLRRNKEAAEQLTEAVRLQPTHAPARALLQRAQSGTGG